MNSYFDFHNTKGVHLCHINIRSIWNKIDIVRQTVMEGHPTIMCFSETWLNTTISDDLIQINDYRIVRQDREWMETEQIKRGGGVCCYIKSDISFSKSEFCDYNHSSKDIEVLWISINKFKNRKFIIGTIYRPPHSNRDLVLGN